MAYWFLETQRDWIKGIKNRIEKMPENIDTTKVDSANYLPLVISHDDLEHIKTRIYIELFVPANASPWICIRDNNEASLSALSQIKWENVKRIYISLILDAPPRMISFYIY